MDDENYVKTSIDLYELEDGTFEVVFEQEGQIVAVSADNLPNIIKGLQSMLDKLDQEGVLGSPMRGDLQ